MKYITLLSLLILSFILNNSYAQVPRNNALEVQCSGQLVNAVHTTYKGKVPNARKVVFNAKADKQILGFMDELMAITEKLKKVGYGDRATNDQLKATFDKIIPVIRKESPKQLKMCMDFLTALLAESKKQCPNLKETDPDYQNKSKPCFDNAMKLPSLAKMGEEWNKAYLNLIVTK